MTSKFLDAVGQKTVQDRAHATIISIQLALAAGEAHTHGALPSRLYRREYPYLGRRRQEHTHRFAARLAVAPPLDGRAYSADQG